VGVSTTLKRALLTAAKVDAASAAITLLAQLQLRQVESVASLGGGLTVAAATTGRHSVTYSMRGPSPADICGVYDELIYAHNVAVTSLTTDPLVPPTDAAIYTAILASLVPVTRIPVAIPGSGIVP
jgi:hypothetical protein